MTLMGGETQQPLSDDPGDPTCHGLYTRADGPGGDRGAVPQVAIVLAVLLTVVLAGMIALLLPDIHQTEPGPNARFEVTIDVEDDQIELLHLAGEPLAADRTRLVWRINGSQYSSPPTSTDETLASGDAVVFTFDGVTTATDGWTAYDSPGTADIQSGDDVRVAIVDTDTDELVYETTVTASDVAADIGAPTHGDDLIWVEDGTPGGTDVMHVNFTIQSGSDTIGNSLNSLEIKFTAGPDVFSGTTEADVVAVGVDTDGDGSIDTDLDGDIDAWTISDGGSRLKIGFSGAVYTNPDAGESILLELDGVSNPTSSGSHEAKLQTSGDGNWQYGNTTVG